MLHHILVPPFYGQISHCLDIPHLIYTFISWWIFMLFQFLAIMNHAVMNSHGQVFFFFI